jgi:hypothetical protein
VRTFFTFIKGALSAPCAGGAGYPRRACRAPESGVN